MNRRSERPPGSEPPVELESQFVLRLPAAPAQSLRHAIREGMTTIKDRLFISMESDMRRGTVRFDNWYLPAKIVDLPTITESYKTIDGKNFYKTADICQMMLCKEDEDASDDESPNKKRRDPSKVEKRYLYPHGLTPPLKNVRKRRFRRTLKKKFVEVPEIEKEVKRLLRMDNEAVNVRHEVVDEEKKQLKDESGLPTVASIKEELGEHDIFGEELSDSDEEADRSLNRMDDPEDSAMSNSKFSVGDSNMSNTMDTTGDVQVKTEFDSSMFPHAESPAKSTPSPSGISIKREYPESPSEVEEQLQQLQRRISDVQAQREAQQAEMASIDNQALRERFRAMVDDLANMEADYRRQYEELQGQRT
ncbi:transcription initiation factor TFIID subunit 7-like [Amphibalanus amphitrite]|uniref:transcription initiation factor TFIID subunit 7-like n=1 Tax=Amphibalanus amphitrite TaxID=1232801 RepID=UPI001C902A3D|nr:transcription initiation factor TFIID subunit 7-like [Amphibalanus amphitrite]XP_043230514.1 transcription initiation factor TFIID subunit 7-like [Amphibalanus amphitrite]XP_043230515.1 transcription initiation factor TFIID subunit 7-like [Amphibalanus amphitrite]XP_043230516.1 transcription initiation factor TFIID subunit 7-like [Amphibalanus amphitrite]XP_043230517.1 transcription initiation factor TFIID subunit 7-like [Amphibalanus amphitrite]